MYAHIYSAFLRRPSLQLPGYGIPPGIDYYYPDRWCFSYSLFLNSLGFYLPGKITFYLNKPVHLLVGWIIKSGYLHRVLISQHQLFSMKITFTISPNNTSFPVLIINNQEISPLPEVPKKPLYRTDIDITEFAKNKNSLDISGVIKGPANTEINLQIDVFIDGEKKPPKKNSPIKGRYSNNKTFIFKTNVKMDKKPTGLQGGRTIKPSSPPANIKRITT